MTRRDGEIQNEMLTEVPLEAAQHFERSGDDAPRGLTERITNW